MKEATVTLITFVATLVPLGCLEPALPKSTKITKVLINNGCWPLAGPRYLHPAISDEDFPINTFAQGWFDTVTELNEKEQRISVAGSIGINWHVKCANFEHLEEFKDTKWVHIDPNILWQPIISQQSTADSFYLHSEGRAINRARLYRNGTITLWYAGVFRSHCNFDFSKFPFDQQKCRLIFESFEAVQFINFTAHPYQFGPTNDEIGDFKILKSKFKVSTNRIIEPDYITEQIIFTIHFQRNSEYYVVILIVPIVFLMLIQQSAHFVPTSNERCNIHLTILLAINLLQQTLDSNIPHLDTTPLICYFLLGFMGTATLQFTLKCPNFWIFLCFCSPFFSTFPC